MVPQAQPRKGAEVHVRDLKPSNPISYIKGCCAVDGVIQIIQSLGFPIACVIAMFAMWQKEVKSHDDEIEKMRSTLEAQSVATTEALNNNTLILTRILDKLGES